MPTYSIWRDNRGDLTLVKGTKSPRLVDEDEQDTTHVMVMHFESSTWEHAIETMHHYQDKYNK
jgi:hypothetical protein